MAAKWKTFIFAGLFVLITQETLVLSWPNNTPSKLSRLKKMSKWNEDNFGGSKSTKNTDNKVIFPSDDEDYEDAEESSERPILGRGCENSTFCENTLNYPSSTIQAALRMNKNLEYFSASDMLPDVKHRLNIASDEVPLCDSIEKVVYPRAALSVYKGWRHIVNEKNFVQGIRIELCKTPSKPCRLIDTFAQGYMSTCEQKYIYKNLVAVVGDKLELLLHRFPVSCNCYVKFRRNWSGSFSKRFSQS